MQKPRLHIDDEDAPTLLFPGVKRSPVRPSKRAQAPTPDSIRRVEDAMRDAELKFDRLRKMLGYTNNDTDRPRAA